MEVKLEKEVSVKGLNEKRFRTNQPLGLKSIVKMLSNYEKNNIKMFECKCSTFSESGNSYHPRFNSIESLESGVKELENPSIGFRAIYIDINTMQYKFDISTNANTNLIIYSVDDKLGEVINKKIELKLMEEEAKQNNQENINGKTNQL